MELKYHLEPHLKRLRLSGVLETLEVRNQQAIDGQWSYRRRSCPSRSEAAGAASATGNHQHFQNIGSI
jgi:hypothetical protein